LDPPIIGRTGCKYTAKPGNSDRMAVGIWIVDLQTVRHAVDTKLFIFLAGSKYI
jgi:hypothetical protein